MKKAIYILGITLAITNCENNSKDENITQNDIASLKEISVNNDAKLVWLEPIADVNWVDTERKNFQIRFTKPNIQGDIVVGEYIETFPGGSTTCKYESTAKGVLNMEILNSINNGVEEKFENQKFEYKLELSDNGKILIVNHSDGRSFRYKRSFLVSKNQNNSMSKSNNLDPNSKLWLDAIADKEWKNIMNNQKVVFKQPKIEGEILTGEFQMIEESFTQVYSYKREANGDMNCKLIRFKIAGDEEFTESNKNDSKSDFIFKSELTEEGNFLKLVHSNGITYSFKPI